MRNGQIYAQGSLKTMMQSEKISALLNDTVAVAQDKNGTFHMTAAAMSNIYDICYVR